MKTQEQSALNQYAEELGISSRILTIEELIDSHRNIRKMFRELNDERNAGYNAGYEAAFEETKKLAMDITWIKIEKLREMTMKEVGILLEECP